jgi:hypothetical protein
MKLNCSQRGCLLLTCVVVHTCVRIEVLNAQCGYYLPRTDMEAGHNNKWRVAAARLIRQDCERQIALQRMAEFQNEHPDQQLPDEATFTGAPFSEAEQRLIETEVSKNRLNASFRDSVESLGLLQYLLGPAGLLWSWILFLGDRSRSSRATSATCGVLNLVSVALMFYRGYFTSLGW